MWHCVEVVLTDVSAERIVSIFRVEGKDCFLKSYTIIWFVFLEMWKLVWKKLLIYSRAGTSSLIYLFICGLFNDALSSSDSIAQNGEAIAE
jgi:hypothetical protein